MPRATPSPPPTTPTTTPPLAIRGWGVALILAVGLGPFLNKAICVDDALFLWSAERIAQTPGNFYGGTVNWYGTEQPLASINKNPPLWCYVLAGLRLVSTQEWWLHLGADLVAVALIAGTWRLARRLGADPARAAIGTFVTPICLVASCNLMTDVPMTSAWVWAIDGWIAGLSQRSPRQLLIAAALIAIGALTKYFALAAVPLLIVYTLLKRRGWTWELLWLGIPLAVMVAYQLITAKIYPTGLLLDAGEYSLSMKFAEGHVASRLAHDALLTIVFLGGGTLPLLLVYPWYRFPRAMGIAIGSAILCYGCSDFFPHWFFEPAGDQVTPVDPPWYWLAQFGVFAGIGILWLQLAFRGAWLVGVSAETWLLRLWILGVLVFSAGLNWTVNTRILLPLVPALCLAICRGGRMTDAETAEKPPSSTNSPQRAGRDWLSVATALGIGMLVAAADAECANASRTAAANLVTPRVGRTGTVYFHGHWGFQYYSQRAGGVPVDAERVAFRRGDVMLVPASQLLVSLPTNRAIQLKEEYVLPGHIPCETMSTAGGAGFYSSVFGPLPFAFGPPCVQRFLVYEIREDLVAPVSGEGRP